MRGKASGLNRNRRAEYYAPPESAPVDEEVLVVEFRDDRDRPRALVTNYAAHPTILGGRNMRISSDWPGAFQRSLEKRVPGAVSFFLNGAVGDLAPRTPRAGKRFRAV